MSGGGEDEASHVRGETLPRRVGRRPVLGRVDLDTGQRVAGEPDVLADRRRALMSCRC